MVNNNTQEDYCSFEVSKLLKEKGFDIRCRYYYDEYETIKDSSSTALYWFSDDGVCYSPTHALVLKWVRENFGIHVHLYYLNEETLWGWDCYKYKEENGLCNEPAYSWKLNHQSYEEAVEAALLYTLKNLI